MQDTWHKYFAEAFATLGLVFVAAGAVLADWQTGPEIGTLGVALATGAALTAMTYAAWHISGAHLNPAVTVALWITGHIKSLSALGYIVAQLVGAVIAALLLKVIFGDIVSPQFYLGDAELKNATSPFLGMIIEGILTFFLVWTFFATLIDKRAASGFGAIAVGLVLTFSIIISYGLTLGALNPARSFGPALVSSHWSVHYVYWIGPLVGGALAGVIYHFGFNKRHG